MRKSKVFFITATDTGVGKTITTLVLGLWLRRRGCKVGVMKPVQCAGSDARFLKMALGLDDDLRVINPYYAPEPLSPHLAFRRAGMKFEKQ
ncbi:MAG: dethiobiotin synthase, partial [Candidatus Omnitrophica bacterium]|nr:dethiobiotin synthase [Candidatus Omnitrophota bacterium]